MENLPASDQASVSSPSVAKQLKNSKWLFIVLGVVILVLLIEGVYYFKLRKGEKALETSVAITPVPTRVPLPPAVAVEPDMAELPEGLTLAVPVGKEYLEKAIIDKEFSQVLSFFLPKDEPIRAVFSGQITQVLLDQKPFPDDLPFNEIHLESEDGKFWVSYVIVGEVLVQEGQSVAEGAILAKAGEGGLGFRSGTNLSFWLHNKDNQIIKLSKEMFNRSLDL